MDSRTEVTARLRHFDNLPDDEAARLFHRMPRAIAPDAGARVLGSALGATLYTPANRADLAADVRRARRHGVLSSVLCLEDSIPDAQVREAQRSIVRALRVLEGEPGAASLVFVRVRSAEQIEEIVAESGGRTGPLVGFVLPKFDADRGVGSPGTELEFAL